MKNIITQDFNSIPALLEAFPTEESCISHLEDVVWIDGIVSPFNPKSKIYKCKNHRYRCKETGKYFNVKNGTLFENTKIKLRLWFLAIWIVTAHKKGISSLQLGRDLDVTQKTAWFMLQRIRNCFGIDVDKLDGEVEIDEAFIGGKNINRHDNKKVDYAVDGNEKAAIVGMIQRQGSLIAKHVKDTKGKTLGNEITKNVKETAKLYTDEYVSYEALKRVYDHSTIKHKEGKYVRGRIHTNTIEGFWSLLKRGIYGIYHSTSQKHLQLYVDEFVFRYNTRLSNEPQRFNKLLFNINHRLTYENLKRRDY